METLKELRRIFFFIALLPLVISGFFMGMFWVALQVGLYWGERITEGILSDE
jgi:hypothetical protein